MSFAGQRRKRSAVGSFWPCWSSTVTTVTVPPCCSTTVADLPRHRISRDAGHVHRYPTDLVRRWHSAVPSHGTGDRACNDGAIRSPRYGRRGGVRVRRDNGEAPCPITIHV